ncbi:response regulator [Pelagibius marinus]|uniref:response regulator n=1 Tax=Pelagibius marinus TaxID=2762760 RepID=UPI0018730295|nr:response regulator transcription factor [Pelagibius marinus]
MRILIVDDHPLVCSALEGMLATAFEPCEMMQAHSGSEALETVRRLEDIDLVLLDLKLPDVEGFQGLLQLRKEAPKLPILVLSGLDDARLVQMARSYGALGFVNKKASSAEIVSAVREVLAGNTVFGGQGSACEPEELAEIDEVSRVIGTLTPQQTTVLRLLGEGLLNKQIAYELSISESTVKAHVSAILKKLEVSSRMQAVLLAQRGALSQSSGAMAGSEAVLATMDR